MTRSPAHVEPATAARTRRLLAIGIPTYKRSAKLLRLLEAFAVQIRTSGRSEEVVLFVSENCSPDDTAAAVARFGVDHPDVTLDYRRHERNVGAVKNIASIWADAGAEYVWFFADDDLPLPGAVETVVAALKRHRPDVLAFSFEQPPGNPNYILPEGQRQLVTSDGPVAARVLCTTYATKLSALVLRVRDFSGESKAHVEEAIEEHGWIHTMLALGILNDTEGWKLVALNEPLAASDHEYRVLRTPADDWVRMGKARLHPFAVRHAPHLAEEQEAFCYRVQFEILWGWRTGRYEVDPEFEHDYWDAIRKLRPSWRLFLRKPTFGLKYALLRCAPRRGPALRAAVKNLFQRERASRP